jgi:hypothetical protein
MSNANNIDKLLAEVAATVVTEADVIAIDLRIASTKRTGKCECCGACAELTLELCNRCAMSMT